ncbi:MAG: RloB family protein, partial [Campylobacter sp.]|nr:RloB family protein [Campylobacter sp.]
MPRSKNTKKPVKSVLIACEDKCASPTYFKKFIQELKEDKRITPTSVVIVKHEHTNPSGVVDDLLAYKDFELFTHKWAVIDRDAPMGNERKGHNIVDFNNAFIKAKSKNAKVAYANDSFELWYLLHFEYFNTPIMRDEIIKQVIKKLKKKDHQKFADLNSKNIKQSKYVEVIYDTLYKDIAIAIQNSKKLIQSYGKDHDPQKDNPSTNLHELIEI